MRWELNRLALAITSMVALAFLVPLTFATRQIAHDRAIGDARQQAAAMVAALAVDADPQLLTSAVASTAAGEAGRLAVHLPGIAPVGATHVTGADVASANRYRRPVTAAAAGGIAYLQPSVLSDGRAVVIEVFVPDDEMTRGVWLGLARARRPRRRAGRGVGARGGPARRPPGPRDPGAGRLQSPARRR
nr:hypothetical protein GCM10020092_007380 [Actinoplanes digitatis]